MIHPITLHAYAERFFDRLMLGYTDVLFADELIAERPAEAACEDGA